VPAMLMCAQTSDRNARKKNIENHQRRSKSSERTEFVVLCYIRASSSSGGKAAKRWLQSRTAEHGAAILPQLVTGATLSIELWLDRILH